MVGATVICNIIAYVCDLLQMHTTMCTYIEPTISQVLSQLCDINFLSSYPPSIVHCQVCEGLPASPAAPHPPHDHPPILLKIFFPLSTFIILVFGDFCHT